MIVAEIRKMWPRLSEIPKQARSGHTRARPAISLTANQIADSSHPRISRHAEQILPRHSTVVPEPMEAKSPYEPFHNGL